MSSLTAHTWNMAVCIESPRNLRQMEVQVDKVLCKCVQGRNLEHDGLPVNEALSMGVHESQSLLWERMVALSQPFAQYLLPKLQQHFPELAQKLSAESLYSAINVIREPSMIRVEADEVTYPLHIILRYK